MNYKYTIVSKNHKTQNLEFLFSVLGEDLNNSLIVKDIFLATKRVLPNRLLNFELSDSESEAWCGYIYDRTSGIKIITIEGTENNITLKSNIKKIGVSSKAIVEISTSLSPGYIHI